MKTFQQASLIRYSKGNATMSNRTRTITSILVRLHCTQLVPQNGSINPLKPTVAKRVQL